MPDRPVRLLFVCLGNICRSPAAEAVVAARAGARGLSVEVESAGTGRWHQGAPPDPRMIAAAARRGYDLSAIRARTVAGRDWRRFDRILAMDVDNLEVLHQRRPGRGSAVLELMLDHLPGGGEVPDPYYGGPKGFETVLDLLEAAADPVLDAAVAERARA